MAAAAAPPKNLFLQRREKLTCTTTTTTSSSNLVSPCSKEFIPKAASSSGAEYWDQLLGAKPRPKRRKIPGIDQDELLEPAHLADPDSCFCEFKGLQIHYKPLRAKSWDKALLEFTAALLTDSVSESKPAMAKRLNEISCPVLIVTGDSDRLGLSPHGSCLEVIKNCGHLPHEEKVEEFMSVVANFLHNAFGGLQKHRLEAAT